MAKLPPANTFHISFDTLEMPGRIVAVEVKLGRRVANEMDSFRIDMCDHPLYAALFRYCMDNPPPGVTITEVAEK